MRLLTGVLHPGMIGTCYCAARGSVGQGRDALLCFMIGFLPVVPLRAVHLFNETVGYYGSPGCQTIPIKWSLALIVRVFAHYWMVIPCVVGLATALLATVYGAGNEFREPSVTLIVGGLATAVLGGLAYLLLWQSDRRNRRIRELLGQHEFGNSDPATWTAEQLRIVSPALEACGTASYAAAVAVLLQKGEHRAAMWAARFTVVLEDKAVGEELTNRVLRERTGMPAPRVMASTTSRFLAQSSQTRGPAGRG